MIVILIERLGEWHKRLGERHRGTKAQRGKRPGERGRRREITITIKIKIMGLEMGWMLDARCWMLDGQDLIKSVH